MNLHDNFCKYIHAKGFAGHQQYFYPSCIREFLFFLTENKINAIDDVKAIHISNYYHHICNRPNYRRKGRLSASMVRIHLFSLRLFFDFLMDSGIRDSSPVYLPKFFAGDVMEREIISEEEALLMFKVCESKLEKAFMVIAYGCGLRRSEIIKLNVNDISFQEGTLLVRVGKLGKSRLIPVCDKSLSIIRDYIHFDRPNRVFNPGENDVLALFLKSNGKRADGKFLMFLLKQLMERTENQDLLNKSITLHSLRHSIATHLMDKGAGYEFIRDFLGHVEMDTSMIYSKNRKIKQKIQQQL